MMLSRLCMKSGNIAPGLFRPTAALVRLSSTEVGEHKREPLVINEGPDRDLVNFPRIKRPEYPGRVRLGFVPEEWFQFFYNKTGVTGPYAFGIGFFTYLLSKEVWVLEHEFYSGISLFIMVVYAIKKFGPATAKYLDKEVDAIEKSFVDNRVTATENCEKSITDEKLAQEQARGMKLLFEAKRENIMLQLEAVFRERQLAAYEAVKRRLDYQVEKLNSQRRLEQRHMVNWIIGNVVKSITEQQEKEALQKCIADLKTLSVKAKA